MQITERDKLSKDVCELCQSKLELTRQYFEQIYAAHVKLLGLLREDEDEEAGVSVEEEMVEYMRTFETREVKVSSAEMILSQPREIVKCEPELPDLHEVKETPLRDAKHFLDELLDEYEDSHEDDDRAEWSGQKLGAGARGRGLMVPPALLRCGECGLVSGTQAENLAHWAAEHPTTSPVYRSVHIGKRQALIKEA